MRRLRPGTPEECPTEYTLRIVGGGWKLAIIHALFSQTKRYGQLQRHLRGISPRMLTKQLRELERDDLIKRKVYAEIPPKVEYSLTPLGKSLRPILEALFEWGSHHKLERALPQSAPTHPWHKRAN
jgi:DNA-binding HxlR family transcriptional regulator